jgi:integrase
VFDRRVVALFIDRGCERNGLKTRGTARSLLLSMGTVLVPDAHPQRLPKLAKSPAPAPYSIAEQAALRSWARGGRTEYRREQSALLLALGIGAGLQRADVIDLRVKHLIVDQDGVLVNVVGGKHPRAVPVLSDWEEALVDTVNSGRDPDTYLVLPRTKSRLKNLFNTQNVSGTGAPSTNRMRATWMVALLSAGIPIRALLDAAGFEYLESFDRYTHFLPDPDPVVSRRLLRGARPTSD